MTALTFDAVKRSPNHRQHAALGARFVRESGWDVPGDYGAVEEELRAVAEGVALIDITARGKVDVRGELASVVSGLAGRKRLDAGGVVSAGTTDGGFHLARVASQWALALTRPESLSRCIAHAEESAAADDAMVTDVTGLYAGFVLVGPAAIGVLSRLTAFDADALGEGACAATRVAEIPSILLHLGLEGSPFELYVGSEYARYAWEAILDAGHSFKIRPAGWEALRAEGWW